MGFIPQRAYEQLLDFRLSLESIFIYIYCAKSLSGGVVTWNFQKIQDIIEIKNVW